MQATPIFDLNLPLEALEESGMLGPMPSPYAASFDKLPGEASADYGWIGVDPATGVWLAQHPLTALAVQHPELTDVVLRCQAGHAKPDRTDYETLASCDYLALLTYHHAEERAKHSTKEAPTRDDS